MLKEYIDGLGLPPLLKMNNGVAVIAENFAERRAELIEALSAGEFGFMPDAPGEIRSKMLFHSNKAYCGKATERSVELSFDTPNGEFTFPLYCISPNRGGDVKIPVIVYPSFDRAAPSHYFPVEEIIDRGFAAASFYYGDVTEDKDDGFTSGIAPMYGKRGETSWGKIGMWAFAASRVADYILTLPELDADNIAVMGHSRLGKTALWAGATDERFRYVISNDSGCAGASLARESERHTDSELVKRIASVFGYWFCDSYKTYGERVAEMPFDQHWLLAAAAPRYLYVASASADAWACPAAEYLGCAAASPAWELLGRDGFMCYDRLPRENDRFHDGNIGYHLRPGTHFLSRYDWNRYMDFIDAKMKK